jgi:hypothetical protein
LGRRLDQVDGALGGLLDQDGADAVAAAVGRDRIGLDRRAVGVGPEVVAGLDRGVEGGLVDAALEVGGESGRGDSSAQAAAQASSERVKVMEEWSPGRERGGAQHDLARTIEPAWPGAN